MTHIGHSRIARACAGGRACYSPKTKKRDQSLW